MHIMLFAFVPLSLRKFHNKIRLPDFAGGLCFIAHTACDSTRFRFQIILGVGTKMKVKHGSKVAIIGAGAVGSSIAFAMAIQQL